MIDLEGLPEPENAPQEGSCIRLERPEEGLVRLHLDPPHRPKLAVFDKPLLRDLDSALTELEQDASVRAIVVAGRDPLSFAGGADIEGIAKVTDPALARKFVQSGQELFQRLHRLGRRGGGRCHTVAAVGGPVPGGAYEIALACDLILLADHKKSRVGLPEVMLGILPAWGGSQRLPRRIGTVAALTAILQGRLYPARKALRMGMVDRLTPPEYLIRVAEDIALGRLKARAKKRSAWSRILVDKNPLAGALIASRATKETESKTRGHYPAPLAAIPLVVRAPRVSLREGLKDEREAVLPLATGPITKNLARIFLGSEEAKKLGESPDGGRLAPVKRAGVMGAGVMGAAIASVLAEKGVSTRLGDLERSALDEALRAHHKEVSKRKQRRSLSPAEALGAIDRLEVTTTGEGFTRCDLAIEAVAEKLEVKRIVLGKLAEQMPDDAILATNTSSLSVDAIAELLPNPERVVGMHFFNPVRKMPLVEIVRGSRTSTEVVHRTARLAIDLGKTPVITKDVAGFLVNRVLGPYLDEAVRLLEAGESPERIDALLEAFGMPMGPCELLDVVGLDIASHAGASLEAAYGERMKASRFLEAFVQAGELGQKSGKGIYRWGKDERGRPKKLEPSGRLAGRTAATPLSEQLVTDRLVLSLVNEAARCLQEEVVAGPRELDLAAVFGTGFAPFRGGFLRYADERGLVQVVETLHRILDSPGLQNGERRGRFEAAPLLATLADEKRTFHET